MTRLDIQFTMFSAFYSPLIATMAGGFLAEEGLEADWSVALPGVSAIAALKDDTAHVVQSALSQSFGPLSRGEVPGVVHFAQINETDGFFLTGRDPDPDFDWRKLEGAEVVLFGGGQPLAMFKYACHKAGIDYERLKPIHPGSANEIDRTFREGQGAYVQQQGPFPQQLEADGMGHVVAQVGRQVGRCGFSSLCARPDWLETDMALAFTRAYRRARLWLNESPAAEVALAERPFFPEIPTRSGACEPGSRATTTATGSSSRCSRRFRRTDWRRSRRPAPRRSTAAPAAPTSCSTSLPGSASRRRRRRSRRPRACNFVTSRLPIASAMTA